MYFNFKRLIGKQDLAYSELFEGTLRRYQALHSLQPNVRSLARQSRFPHDHRGAQKSLAHTEAVNGTVCRMMIERLRFFLRNCPAEFDNKVRSAL